jgi:hypothetical protein
MKKYILRFRGVLTRQQSVDLCDVWEVSDDWLRTKECPELPCHRDSTRHVALKVWENGRDVLEFERKWVRMYPKDGDFFAEAESFEDLKGNYVEYFL